MRKMVTPLILIGGAVAAIVLASKAKAEPEEPEEPKSNIKIDVYDSDGNLVPANSPLNLDEGSSYTVKLTVKNNSTKGEQPWAATLGIGISAIIGVTTLISTRVDMKDFSASQTKSFTYSMNVPWNTGGQSGEISAWVEDPTGYSIASDQENISITTVSIDYEATIVIG